MQCLIIATPDEDPGYTGLRVLIPDASVTTWKKTELSVLKQGGKSPLGNSSVTHKKLELDIVPLNVSYNVKRNPNLGYANYYCDYVTTNLPYGNVWTAILANVPHHVTSHKEYGAYSIEHGYSVKLRPGECIVVTTYTVEYTSPTIKGYTEMIITTFKQLRPGSLDITHTQRILFIRDGVVLSERTNNYGISRSLRHFLQVDVLQLTPSIGMLESYEREAGEKLQSEKIATFGQLVNRGASNADKAFQASSVMYLMKLKELNKVFDPYISMIKAGVNAQSAANAWLSYYYGARLSAKQGYSIISGIVRDSHRRVTDISSFRARDPFVFTYPNGKKLSGYRSLTTYYYTHSSGIVNSYRTLRRYGFMPSLSLAWDIIPYSFVVDWLVPIGNLLASVDNDTFLQSLTVNESLTTTKLVYQIRSEFSLQTSLVGMITYSSYDRILLPGCMPKPEVEFSLGSLSGLKVLNGSSLVVQRLK